MEHSQQHKMCVAFGANGTSQGHTLHVRRAHSQPAAMEYSVQSQCLVALYEDVQGDDSRWSGLAVHDMAAGGRILCRLRDLSGIDDSMCVLPFHAP